jgi:hypothetical protein
MLDQGWGMMPNQVLFDEQLSSGAKLMFCYIMSLCAKRGHCWASNEHLATKFGISKRTASRLLSELERFLLIDESEGGKRLISIDKNGVGYRQKCPPPLDKNVHHNKTSVNNTNVVIPPKPPKGEPREMEPMANMLAEELAQMVHENYDFATVDPAHWAPDIEKLHRIDGYDYKLIEAVLKWSQQDSFWKQNIRSGSTLRKQFEKLLIRIKTEQQNKQGGLINVDAEIERRGL